MTAHNARGACGPCGVGDHLNCRPPCGCRYCAEMREEPSSAARRRVARSLRRFADRIDHHGAPKATHLFFTFERGKGLVVNEEGRGCRLWHYGDDDYEKAHSEALNGL